VGIRRPERLEAQPALLLALARVPRRVRPVAPRLASVRPVPGHGEPTTAQHELADLSRATSRKQAGHGTQLQRPGPGRDPRGGQGGTRLRRLAGGGAGVRRRRARLVGCPDGRAPGSWEADLIQQLVKGTVGSGDEYLADHQQLQT
jgi:hypothetical protein